MIDRQHSRTGRRVPQLHGHVSGTGSERCSRQSEARHGAGVSWNLSQWLDLLCFFIGLRSRVPLTNDVVRSARNDLRPVTDCEDRRHGCPMLEYGRLRASRRRKQSDRSVRSAGRNLGTGRRERDGVDGSRVSGQSPYERAVCDLRNSNGSVGRSRRHQSALRIDGHRGDWHRVSGHCHGCRRQIPDADRSVRSRRRDLLPVRADDDIVNGTGVAGEAQSIRTVGSIPQPDDAGIAAADHQSFVSTQSDRRNRTDLTGQ